MKECKEEAVGGGVPKTLGTRMKAWVGTPSTHLNGWVQHVHNHSTEEAEKGSLASQSSGTGQLQAQ